MSDLDAIEGLDCENDVGSSLASTSDSMTGLALPEGCELALRIVSTQEDYCTVWGSLQRYICRASSADLGEEEDDDR